MAHRRVVLLACSLLVSIVPAASAWSVNGGFEPDTPHDIADERMYLEADTDPDGRKVYFNVVPTDRNSASFNPNVAATGSRYVPAGRMGMNAWLGIWKDCNADGYVGMVETAVNEYRAELLLDDDTCPPGGPFNRNGWVSEFLYLSTVFQNHTASFPRVVYDKELRVWGDFGRPGVTDEVHYDCAQTPLPKGTTDSTGGLLLYADCQLGYTLARTVSEQGGSLGLAYEDVHHPERDCDHPLYVGLDTYGDDPCAPDDPGTIEGNTTRAATVWDCTTGGDELLAVPDPTAEGETLVSVDNPYGVSPSVGDPEGSLFATADAALFPCTTPDEDFLNGKFVLGADFSGTNPTEGKRLADFHFEYVRPGRGISGVHQGVPGNAGIRGPSTGAWDSTVTYLPPPYLGGTVRNSDFQPAGGLWFTFYAYVGPATLTGARLPNENAASYGFEACEGETSGVHRGWDCDPEHWWNPDLGGSANADGPRPGDLYHLKDTDCYDGAIVSGVPVYASLAGISEAGACPRMGPVVVGALPEA